MSVVAAAEPSPEALMHLVLDRLKQDHEAYPVDLVKALRDELGTRYPQFLVSVQAPLDAALAELQAQVDAAAKAEAEAAAQATVPGQTAAQPQTPTQPRPEIEV